MMRTIRVVLALTVLSSCNRDREYDYVIRDDGSFESSAGGEVSLTDGGRLSYSITSNRYRQWYQAQQGIDRATAARFGALLQPKSPSQQSIERSIRYLEGNARARRAIETAGMSVREFVLMTVALEQEMRLASGEGRPRPEPPPYMESPYPLDTFAIPPSVQPLPPVDPMPSPALAPAPPTGVDSFPPSSRLIFDTLQRGDTSSPRVVRTDTIRQRDTVSPGARPAPTPTPPQRDTSVARSRPDTNPGDATPRDTSRPRRDDTTAQIPSAQFRQAASDIAP